MKGRKLSQPATQPTVTKEQVAAAPSRCMIPPQQQTAELDTASPPHQMTLLAYDAYLEDQ